MTQRLSKLIYFLAIVLLLPVTLNPAQASTKAHQEGGPLDREQVSAFIKEMSEKHNMNRRELEGLFKGLKMRDDIIAAMTRPAESKPWYEYREIFLTPDRVEAGRRFWNKNHDTLRRAEEQFGVPAEIIVAIIGVETRFGRHQGKYKVVEALATLAFHYPPRAEFFRKELVEFMLLCRDEDMDPNQIKGSYAGAMGKPQFIPSSYRMYAVDFDGDGKRDLLNSTADAIGSVANYFKRHKWQPGDAVITRANVRGKKYKALVKKGVKPNTSLEQMRKKGVLYSNNKLPKKQLGALIELENARGHEHWVGLQNFFVITRYNHSPLYAMAVYQLSQQIVAERRQVLTR